MNQAIIDRQVEAMWARGLDALIVISPENVAYTTGFLVPSPPLLRWRHCLGVVTAARQLGMVVVDMEESTVRDRVPIEEIRSWNEFTENPMDRLAELLTDLGLTQARVGIEMDYLPARDFLHLQRRLPKLQWAEGQGIFNELRQLKTPEELALLRCLSRLTDQAIRDALASVKAGMTEMDIAGPLARGIFAGGAENFRMMIIASGERSQYPNVGPTERVLRPGDLIRVEIFGVLQGYHAGVCRTAVVGEPSVEQARIWSNLITCRRLVMDAIQPGASAAKVYQTFLSKFQELGFKPISFVGHGIGLFLHEEPYLGKYGDATLRAGMVLGIEPLVYHPGKWGLQCKDMVAVTEQGCELLSDVTDTAELFRVQA